MRTAIAIGLVLCLATAAQANLIGNPSFVSTAGTGPHTQGGGVNDWAGITRWYVATGGTPFLPHTGETYSDGAWSMQGAGFNAPVATQKIPSVIWNTGDKFDFKFWTIANGGGFSGRMEIGFDSGGGFTPVATVTGVSTTSWSFHGNSVTSTNAFGEDGYAMEVHMVTINPGGGATSWFDDLELLETPAPVVPEPATMSLLALGGLALLRRRRR